MAEDLQPGEVKNVAWVPFDTMEEFMTDSLVGAGVPREDAKITAEVLITADKRGIDSHGTNRLKPIYIDRINKGIQNAVTNFEIIKETPSTVVVDGHHGMGHVVAKKAMQMAIDKAKKVGLGMAVCRNSTHYGIAGYYALMAAEAGCVGMVGTNARPSVAPTYGTEPMLGTNPLTFGMPSDEDFPFCIDCATSTTQRGKLEVYGRKGIDCPPGWVVDEHGKAATDTQEILGSFAKNTVALAPLGGLGEILGGHKGYGWSCVVEILSAALSQNVFLKALLPGINLGHFFLAIDITAFTELDLFKKTTGQICRELRASRIAPNAKRIYTAGEKEHLAYLYRKDKGVPVNKSLQEEILFLKKEYKLDKYKFPF